MEERGFSAATLLGIAFIVLKLTGYIAWPWMWVLAPFWVPVVLVIGFLLATVGLMLLFK